MEKLIIQTEKMIASGLCIAHVNGKTVFVSGTLPDEELSVKIISSKKDYDNAVIDKILKASVHRIKPLCPYFGKCGGCNLSFAAPEYQKRLRKEILFDSFVRAFNQKKLDFPFNLDDIKYIGDSPYGYRNRFQLHDGCFFENKSNIKVPVKNCLIAYKNINDFLNSEKPWEKEQYKGRIQIFASDKLTEKKVHLAGKETSSDEENKVTVKLAGKYISFDNRGFFQSNLNVLEKVLPVLTENLSGKHLLDIYCGTGTLSAFTDSKFEKYSLVEYNAKALKYAKENLKFENVTSYALTGEKYINGLINKLYPGDFDAVIADPPRSGMEKAVSDYLCQNKVPLIRSLSCDPVTHARDMAKLVSSGYKLKRLILCDFYPQSSHIESLAFLEL